MTTTTTATTMTSRRVMQLAYKYRIYPNREQEMLLKRSLLSLCNLYNKLRDLKIRKYKEDGTSLTLNDLREIALEERRNSKELQSIYSQVVQEVADRVHNAFDRFFEGIARFPRHKQPKKYRSLTYTQSGFGLKESKRKQKKQTRKLNNNNNNKPSSNNNNNNSNNNNKLYLSKIGYVRIFMHRPLEGKVVRLTVKYEAGEWYAIFIVEKEVLEPNPDTKTIIDDITDTIPDNRIKAIDLGINNFITLDDGLTIDYPKYLRNTEDKIKVLQKHLSRKKKGSRRWKQLCFRLAKLHLHVKRQREDFHNKVISWLLKHNDVIIIERLNVNSMIQSSSNNKGLTKSIVDVSFGTFIRKIISKARMILGKYVIVVDPTNTSQFCYNCLTFVPKELKDREHICPKCNVRIDRDLNSAKLIKRIGLDGISLSRNNKNNNNNKKKNKTIDNNTNNNTNNNRPTDCQGVTPIEQVPLPSSKEDGKYLQ
jgi:putative transposase